MSPTARTLALLRREGYIASSVERFLPRVNRRRDLLRRPGRGPGRRPP
jgi:hypothetical protein